MQKISEELIFNDFTGGRLLGGKNHFPPKIFFRHALFEL